jgi:hypothetical protein
MNLMNSFCSLRSAKRLDFCLVKCVFIVFVVKFRLNKLNRYINFSFSTYWCLVVGMAD